jgi:hypothetical protein
MILLLPPPRHFAASCLLQLLIIVPGLMGLIRAATPSAYSPDAWVASRQKRAAYGRTISSRWPSRYAARERYCHTDDTHFLMMIIISP